MKKAAIIKTTLDSKHNEISSLFKQNEEVIIPKVDADSRDCTLEVQSAAGGSESSLFAEDLVEMYKNYCGLMGFRFKMLDF